MCMLCHELWKFSEITPFSKNKLTPFLVSQVHIYRTEYTEFLCKRVKEILIIKKKKKDGGGDYNNFLAHYLKLTTGIH